MDTASTLMAVIRASKTYQELRKQDFDIYISSYDFNQVLVSVKKGMFQSTIEELPINTKLSDAEKILQSHANLVKDKTNHS